MLSPLNPASFAQGILECMPRLTPETASLVDCTFPDTPSIRAALAHGVDVGALVAQLACTPAERLRRLDALVSLQRRVVRMPDVSAQSVIAARRAARP